MEQKLEGQRPLVVPKIMFYDTEEDMQALGVKSNFKTMSLDILI